MTKLFNTSFREQEGKHFIDYYTEPEPQESNFIDYNKYDAALQEWLFSKQSIEVHQSQVEGFKNLCFIKIAKDKNINPRFITEFSQNYTLFINKGIEIPSEMIEIRNCGECSDCRQQTNEEVCQRAFLKQKTSHDYSKQESQLAKLNISIEKASQDELWNELLKISTDLVNKDYDTSYIMTHLKSKFTITKK